MARIVIIEDNTANLSLMSYLLQAVGHTLDGYRDGHSGLEAVRREPPDLVVCDIQLPRLSGYELAREVRADPSLRQVPLVAVTALAMRGDREKVLAGGFDGYIEKPIQPETFAAQVEEHLPDGLRRGPSQPAARAPATPEPRESEPSRAPHATVLAVDDVASNRKLAQTIFESAGYRVLTAPDMHQALATMQREQVDLVVSDVHMRDGDGFAFRRAVAADPALKHIPFIFVSSSVVRDEDRRQAEQLSVYRLIERPVEADQLLAVVASCLRGGSPLRGK